MSKLFILSFVAIFAVSCSGKQGDFSLKDLSSSFTRGKENLTKTVKVVSKNLLHAEQTINKPDELTKNHAKLVALRSTFHQAEQEFKTMNQTASKYIEACNKKVEKFYNYKEEGIAVCSRVKHDVSLHMNEIANGLKTAHARLEKMIELIELVNLTKSSQEFLSAFNSRRDTLRATMAQLNQDINSVVFSLGQLKIDYLPESKSLNSVTEK